MTTGTLKNERIHNKYDMLHTDIYVYLEEAVKKAKNSGVDS